MNSHKFLSSLLASCLGATLTLAVVIFVGSNDFEASGRIDSNWGARYLLKEPVDSPETSGIKRIFGVPVFDGAQGLGHRLPNFASTPHLSPVILLSKWIPTHFLSLLTVWVSIVLLTLATISTFSSWNEHASRYRLIPVFGLTLAPVTSYLLFNDFALSLAGMLSSLAIVACLLNKGLSATQHQGDEYQGCITAVAMLLVSTGVQLATNPRYLLLLTPIYIALIDRVWRAVLTIIRTPLLLIATVLMTTSVSFLAVEYLDLGMSGESIRGPVRSILDLHESIYVDPIGLRTFIFAIASHFLLPVMRIVMDDKWHLMHARTEFFNLWFLISLLILLAFVKSGSKKNRMEWISLRAVLAVLLWMVLGGAVVQVAPYLRLLFLQDGWDLSYVMAYVSVLGSTIAISLRRFPRGRVVQFESGKRWFTRIAIYTYLLGSVISVLLPIGQVKEAPTLNGDSRRRDWLTVPEVVKSGKPRLDLATVRPAGRTGWTSPRIQSDWGCLPRNTWEKRTGLSHAIVLAREGHAVIESFPAFRSNGLTLRPIAENEEDLIYVCDALLDSKCSLRVLDFLSFREMPPLNLSPRCMQESSSGDVTSLRVWAGDSNTSMTGGHAYLGYHNYFIKKSTVSSPETSYCSLVGGCLSSSIQSVSSVSEPPWRLCASNCWFTYQVFSKSNERDSLVLLPARYDDAMRISVASSPDFSPRVVSYRGLAAVDLSSMSVPNELTVFIDTDGKQMRIALIPYQMLLAMTMCSIAVFRRRNN